MNQNHIPEENENIFRENISEDNWTTKSRKNNIIAFIVCVVLAFSLWLVIRNATPDTGVEVNPPSSDQQTAGQVQ